MGGSLGGLLGVNGGAAGTGFSRPTADVGGFINTPYDTGAIQTGQTGVNSQLQQQQALLSALQAQQAPDVQSGILGQGQGTANALGQLGGADIQGTALGQQAALANALGGAGGLGLQQTGAAGLQAALAQQQAIGQGQGPNPAQAMLNQTTGQNVANQAALMAGQRGAGANVGLMARQAAQQGAATQQQAAGQAATMEAQQQLGALNQMTGAGQALAGVGAGLTGQQAGAIQNLYGQGANTIGQLQQQQALNAGIAQNQIQNQMGVNQMGIQGNLGNTGQILNAIGQANAQRAGLQQNVNAGNVNLAQQEMQGQQGLLGGALNAAGLAMAVPAAAAAAARGGEVKRKKMATGGGTSPAQTYQSQVSGSGPQSSLGQFLQSMGQGMGGQNVQADNSQMTKMGNQALNQGMTQFGKGLKSYLSSSQPDTSGNMGGGDQTNLQDNPSSGIGGDASGTSGITDAGPTMDAAKGGLAKSGGHVAAKKPSQKPVKKGDSYANDKVPAMLSAGEIVIPRSVLQGPDPVKGAADFVAKTIAKRGKK